MTNPASLTPQSLGAMIDHTLLKACGGPEQITALCEEARRYGFATVMVNGSQVRACASLLAGSPVRVGAVAGFPLGQSTLATKQFEIRDAIRNGAGEIDMVINQRALQAGDLALVRREMSALVALCKPVGVVSKLILECCNLDDPQKIAACRIARELGCDFVKTSTGFASGGATVEDVRLMRQAVGPAVGVKAAGGIRDLATALAMVEAGANRIGTSSGVRIVEELVAGGGLVADASPTGDAGC